jgi:L-arabinokinase
MGLRILEVETGRHMNGYLCNLTAGEWERLRDSVPREMSGREYLENYGALPDSVTTVVPEELYFPRSASEHPILENERVKRFSSLLGGAGDDTNAIREAGQLMLESHRSYSDRVHLGSPETDLLVEMLMERGPECGIYGAKITGGGSGGTVAVLCTGPDAHSALEDVRTQYRERTGILPQLFEGSSPGALACGVRTLDSTA